MNLVNEDESIDDLKLEGLRLIQKNYAFRFGVDAVLLSHFANIKSNIQSSFGCNKISRIIYRSTIKM